MESSAFGGSNCVGTFLELFECAYKVMLVIEIRDGSKVFELVEGDFTQIRGTLLQCGRADDHG